MKFIDLTTRYKITGERVSLAVSVTMVLLLCTVGVVAVSALLDRRTKDDLEMRRREAMQLASAASEVLDTADSSGSSSDTSSAADGTTSSSVTASETETADSSDVTEESSATESAEATEETTAANGETEYYARVYAERQINLRRAPGTDAEIVRVLEIGEVIDVVAVTDDGWYRTYNGNYVLASLTSDTPIATTAATTTAAATSTAAASATAAPTTTATTTAATTTTAFTEQSSNANIDGMTYYGSCRITFYGPQPNGDGTYSTGTATGTTCSQGRTVAADWSVFPAGTVIYIPNDPLGGDGYYTVEDRGSGVNGDHIDIYADNGEELSTTTREVYVVN